MGNRISVGASPVFIAHPVLNVESSEQVADVNTWAINSIYKTAPRATARETNLLRGRIFSRRYFTHVNDVIDL